MDIDTSWMADESAMPCLGVYEVSLDELETLPDLAEGQADSLKIEFHDEEGRPYERVWLSRCSAADGEPWDNKVTVERRDERGRWVTAELWRAE